MRKVKYPLWVIMEFGDIFLMVTEGGKITRSGALNLIKSVIKETLYMVHELDINQVLSDESKLQRFIDIVLDSCDYIDVVGPWYNDENVLSRKIIAMFLVHLSRSGYAVNGIFPYGLERVGPLLCNNRAARLPFFFIYQKVLDYAHVERTHRHQHTSNHQ